MSTAQERAVPRRREMTKRTLCSSVTYVCGHIVKVRVHWDIKLRNSETFPENSGGRGNFGSRRPFVCVVEEERVGVSIGKLESLDSVDGDKRGIGDKCVSFSSTATIRVPE